MGKRYSGKLAVLILFLLTFLIFHHKSSSQEAFITLSGKIIDSETSKSIPFANIGIAGKNIGTVTNEKGDFIFKVPSDYKNDSLRISSIGYNTFTQPISALGKSQLLISLKSATVTLEEVIVEGRKKTGEELLKEAIRAIPNNYDTAEVLLTAFYYEETKLNDYPVTHLESVLAVKRPSYSSKQLDEEIRTIKERRKKTEQSKDIQFDIWLKLMDGAKNAIKSGNFVRFYKERNKSISFFNERNFKYYDFALQSIISDGERSIYVIEIQPKKQGKKAYMKGKIYLDLKTLAFVRTEFELTDKGLDLENNRNKIMKKMGEMIVKANLKLSHFREVMNFENYDNKWYVKDVQRNIEALVNSKKRNLENSLWKTDLFLTTTEINRINQDSSKNENVFQLTDENQINANNDFWEKYNVIKLSKEVKPGEFKEYTDSSSTSSPKAEATQSNFPKASNRQNGFTRADTLQGSLTPLRTCYDVTFYDLDVKVDIENKFISGSNKIRFLVKEPFRKMQVDLYANMEISKIAYGKTSLSYSREFNAVYIEFPDFLKQNNEEVITIFYSGKPKEPNRAVPMDGGFLWEKDKDGNPWVQVVCQGSGASLWWPNKDHLSDEPDSAKISITVPNGLIDVSNGRLREKMDLPDNLTKYVWYVSYPINNYNITLNIGKYVHLQDNFITNDTLTLDYYVLPYNVEKGKVIFKGVKSMLSTLESHYGKYPFPRDGFKLLEAPYPMEHQSAVTFGKIPEGEMLDSLEAPMSLVWHETAHEWWGNNVSCKDMADMWIHEAFAVYSERLYTMNLFGKEAEREFIEDLKARVSGKKPIIGVRNVNHIHYDIEDMYSKGALVLHTFRNVLNNEALWSDVLQGIQQEFRYKTVTTDDLIKYINHKTNTDYTYFFDQYLKCVSIPKLAVKLAEKDKSLTIQYKWIADVDNFRMPIDIITFGGNYKSITPTTNWQSLILPNMTMDDFEVDQERFYVEVEVD